MGNGTRSAGQTRRKHGALILPVWRPAARADRKRITDYIAEDNPKAAIELGDTLIEKAGLLGDNPMQGRIGRVKGTRELVAHPNYILIYRVVGTTVEVLRVKHAAQKWP
jgi:addiction module RelE/StbE family toxin